MIKLLWLIENVDLLSKMSKATNPNVCVPAQIWLYSIHICFYVWAEVEPEKNAKCVANDERQRGETENRNKSKNCCETLQLNFGQRSL